MKEILLAALLALLSGTSFAAYNSNIRGELDGVYVYTNSDAIYLHFKDQPTSHPACKPNYFVIPGDIPLERRQMLLSRLMMAFASKEWINIGYDNAGTCADGHIRVYRAG